jgi:pimeloyl-ACP methyl ester carboxylesterase
MSPRPDEGASHDAAAPEIARRRGVRWWPLVVSALVLLVVLWACVTEWVGITGSHPAYLVTLVLASVGAAATIAWALRTRPRPAGPLRTWLPRVALVLGGVGLAAALVFLRPMSATSAAIDALDDSNGLSVDISRSAIRMTPDGARATGLAFYPGALVDPRAYARVLRPVAAAGFPVIIYLPPYNLAVLDSRAANDVVGDPEDEVTRWVIGGHSLGGAMAASFAETARDELVGMLFFAAWPVSDMSDRIELEVLSVYGTNDAIATPDEIDESAAELPSDTEFVAIDGAIHSFFGDYGDQRGDGTPGVEREVAQGEIAGATIDFLARIDGPDS